MTPLRSQSIACIGEVMLELVETTDGTPKLGVAGDTYNTAVYLARALQDTPVTTAYVTAIGTDPYSEKILAEMARHGLDQRFVERRANALPGIYAVHTTPEGERSFSYWRSESAARTLFQSPCDITLDRLDTFGMVYLSGISIAILPRETRQSLLDWIDAYRSSGGIVAFDSNYRPRLWPDVETAREATRAFWSRADIALPSVDDEMALFGDATEADVVARLKGFGVVNGALKRGAEGPIDLTGETGLTNLTVVSDVVDTTAAGDSFNAGYLAQIIKDGDAVLAMRAGHDLACRVVQHPGAIIPLDA